MRIASVLGLILALSACALPQGRSRTFAPYQPLEAYITNADYSGPLFHVNRPAYVAMFYIAPGSGVSMIYPGFGRGSLSGRVFAGTHFASTRLSNRHQYFFTAGTSAMPRYLFLIASDRPLNLEQFGPFGHRLASRLGTYFHSFSAHRTMEELVRLALPSVPDDGSWTTDFYVVWPSVIYSEPAAGRILVSCGNYAMYVPRGYVQVVRSVICSQLNDDQKQQPEKPDEGKKPPRKPGARDPLPSQPEREVPGTRAITAEQREAIRERISSAQLAASRERPQIGARPTAFGRLPAEESPRPGSAGGWSSAPSSRGAGAASVSRPAAPASRAPVREVPSASPASSAGSRGPVAAPATRSGGGDGGSSSRGARPTPRAD
ncbi:MAG TPA: hypothetical protein VF167_10545 [Longimicrobiaceae bacterium]